MQHKLDKAGAHYSIGHQTSHCGRSFPDDKNYCRYFVTPQSPENQLGTCQRVSGPINKVYWCKLFSKAVSK